MMVAKCEVVDGIQCQEKKQGIVIKKKPSNNAGQDEIELHKCSRESLDGFDEEVHLVKVVPKDDSNTAALKKQYKPLEKKLRTRFLDGSIAPDALERFIDENRRIFGDADGISGKCESL
jgi:hypothetical protein